MPRQLLSSKLTIIYKIVPVLFALSTIWTIAVFVFGMGVWDEAAPPGLLIFVLCVCGLNILWMGWLAIRSNRVEADDVNFYVSNFGKHIVIPRADLFEATEMRWFKPYWITLHLRRPSEFGDKIVFIPPWRIGAFWTANPLVEELNSSSGRKWHQG